jgi:hypothetical protein
VEACCIRRLAIAIDSELACMHARQQYNNEYINILNLVDVYDASSYARVEQGFGNYELIGAS